MANASKRIDLAAPLLSVRRHGGAGAETPSCKLEAAPGGVPFCWEHRPGHPKSVRTRRGPPPPAAAAVLAAASESSERFSDALSRVNSCLTVNCSVTGLSDPGGKPAGGGGVMMDRFLPAALAMAAGSPQCTFRNAGAAAGSSVQEATRLLAAPINARPNDGDRSPWRLRAERSPSPWPVNHVPSNNAKGRNGGNDDDEEGDEHSTRGFASNRCGLLLPAWCMRRTLLLLNPAPAIRRRGGAARRGRAGKRFLAKVGRGQRATKPLVRRQRNGQRLGLDDIANATVATSKSWEEVYVNSLRRSDRSGRKQGAAAGGGGAMVSVQDRGVHPKAGRLGLLLLLDNDGAPPAKTFPDGSHPALPPPRKGSRPARPYDGGYGFPLLLEEKAAASGGVVSLLLPLPPPNAPSESWLSRALPSVSSKPPATSFLGMRVQPRKRAPPPCCSDDQTTAMIDHAAPW